MSLMKNIAHITLCAVVAALAGGCGASQSDSGSRYPIPVTCIVDGCNRGELSYNPAERVLTYDGAEYYLDDDHLNACDNRQNFLTGQINRYCLFENLAYMVAETEQGNIEAVFIRHSAVSGLVVSFNETGRPVSAVNQDATSRF